MLYKTAQILRGAETIRKNSMTTTNTPRTKQKWIPNPNYETATHEVDPKLPPQEQDHDTPRTKEASVDKGGMTFVWVEFAEQLERELAASKAEVERLKDILNRTIAEIEKAPFHSPKLTAFTAHRLAERYREEMTNTSTHPDKCIGNVSPANPTCNNTTHKYSHCDCSEPSPDWRELGPDEVIQEGDEFNQNGSYDWGKCGEYFLSTCPKAHSTYHPLLRFRTRRPLPKQDDVIEKHANSPLAQWSNLECLRYLRNEIQKLKES